MLSQKEKQNTRENLQLFMEKHPVRNSGGARLLLQARSKLSAFADMLMTKQLNVKLQPMTILLMIALLVSGGASMAAEQSLPGDALYPIKVGVNEEVRGWATISDESKAKWDTRRAERRLEETEKLASEGRLNAEARAEVKTNFESHAEDFEKRVGKIEAKKKIKASLEARSNFEAALNAHERVLTQIFEDAKENDRGDDKKSKEDIRVHIQPILLDVRAKLHTATEARSDAEAKVSAETNGEFKEAAEGKLKAAENKIQEVRDFLTRIKTSISAESHARAEAELKSAEEVLIIAKGEINVENYGQAFSNLQKAMSIAQEAKLIATAEEKIKLDVLPIIERKDREKRNPDASVNIDAYGKVQIDFDL